MREIKTLNTIEDLVNEAVIGTNVRYKLETSTSYEYDDLVAGREWEEREEEVVGKYPGTGSNVEQRDAWYDRHDAYRELKPNSHAVYTWYLSNDYRRLYQLSAELGESLDSLWTKKASRYSDEPERTGQLTLAGMLKRLGRTDVAQKIRDAENQRKERDAKNRRNNTRSMFARKLKELETMVTDYGAEIGVTTEMFQLPPELADKLVEEP